MPHGSGVPAPPAARQPGRGFGTVRRDPRRSGSRAGNGARYATAVMSSTSARPDTLPPMSASTRSRSPGSAENRLWYRLYANSASACPSRRAVCPARCRGRASRSRAWGRRPCGAGGPRSPARRPRATRSPLRRPARACGAARSYERGRSSGDATAPPTGTRIAGRSPAPP